MLVRRFNTKPYIIMGQESQAMRTTTAVAWEKVKDEQSRPYGENSFFYQKYYT